MTKEQYLEICSYISEITAGTEWDGHVFVVGGAVRSYAMGDDIKDVDMVVDFPEGGIRLGRFFSEKRLLCKKPEEFPEFGVTKFHLAKFPEEEIECVHTRREHYPDRDSRNPVTEFGNLSEDCFRRDLTVNALYYKISTGEIVDITGKGIDDIHNKIIRVTRDAVPLFDEDPLRILRTIRFAARFGWDIEPDTLAGIKATLPRLSMLTQGRITEELEKMLLDANPGRALRLIESIGALEYVLPEFVETVGMTQNKYHNSTVWEHTLKVLDGIQSPDIEVRLAALLHDIGKVRTRTVNEKGDVHFIGHDVASAKMAGEILKRLKYSNAVIKDVTFLVGNHMRLKNYTDDLSNMRPQRLRRFLYICGTKERFLRLTDLINADNNAHAEGHCLPNQIANLREMAKTEERMFGYKLPINGRDIMDNLAISKPSDVHLYLDHALTLAFAYPDWTRDRMLQELKKYKPVKNN